MAAIVKWIRVTGPYFKTSYFTSLASFITFVEAFAFIVGFVKHLVIASFNSSLTAFVAFAIAIELIMDFIEVKVVNSL